MRDELNLLLSTLEGGGAPQCGVTVRGSRRSFDFSLSVPDAASLSLCAHHALPARTPPPIYHPQRPERSTRLTRASRLSSFAHRLRAAIREDERVQMLF